MLGPATGQLDLSQGELELLVRLCRKHRNTLPIYLLAAQEELDLVDGALRKLLLAAS